MQESFKRDAKLYLPMANITKIMRRMLPENAKIADAAKETVQECVSEFIDHITRQANEICHRDHRRTITPEDLLLALETTRFHKYAQTLTLLSRKQRKEDVPSNIMPGGPLLWPNVVGSVDAHDQVAQQEVDHWPRNMLTDPMDSHYKPNFGEGSSCGPTNDGFDLSLEEFDVYQQFEFK
ncbi:nuclear transcription factor Y subunit B-9-like [Dorcoceras hygrometricum]|uniref:Nuclear transcription factor Y subunit B-9-like n=1 Tax=Dorcoceras hygrometricum TaxID=472368 RepID=A0A2Z7BA31_9LAMI|nr:nuclear transcription factor Y subunit B-9-like [Dorcoceras hygrometricum]